MSSSLDLLESRLKWIEERVFGEKGCARELSDSSLANQLTKIEAKLGELTAGKDRFNHCYEKMKELEEWFDSELLERMSATDLSKYEEIVAYEQQIRDEALMFDKIDGLQAAIDSPHIRNLDELQPKLNQIRALAIKQSEQSCRVDDQTTQLLVAYNQWLAVIKQQLFEWDKKLRALEEESGSRRRSTRLEFD